MIPHCSSDLHFPDNYWCWASFHKPVGHLYVLFVERSKSFAHFSNEVICGFVFFFCFTIELGVSRVFWKLTLLSYMVCIYFPPFHRLFFHSVDCFLCSAETCSLMYLSVNAFVAYALGVIPKKLLARSISRGFPLGVLWFGVLYLSL